MLLDVEGETLQNIVLYVDKNNAEWYYMILEGLQNICTSCYLKSMLNSVTGCYYRESLQNVVTLLRSLKLSVNGFNTLL